jgi:hypothetical protein
VRADVLEYYRVIRELLHRDTGHRLVLSRCCHCGILFLTHPRNAVRRDLRCPFGCRQTHRKQSSTKRSTKYYRTTEGKFKKQLQNGRRTEKVRLEAETQEAVTEDSLALDEAGLTYLQTIISIIEQRHVIRQEIFLLLREKMRQHSIDNPFLKAYTHSYPNKKPP